MSFNIKYYISPSINYGEMIFQRDDIKWNDGFTIPIYNHDIPEYMEATKDGLLSYIKSIEINISKLTSYGEAILILCTICDMMKVNDTVYIQQNYINPIFKE